MKIILITGGTASGKTSLSEKLAKKLGGAKKVNVINMDDYYYPQSYFVDEKEIEPKKINWDSPKSYNLELLNEHIVHLLNNKEIKKNKFIYGVNEYAPKQETLKKKDWLIIEGIFSMYDVDVRDSAFIQFFVDSPEFTRLERRIERDKKLVPGFDEETFEKKWKKTIQKAYKRYIKKWKKKSDYIVDSTSIETESDWLINQMMEEIDLKLDKIKIKRKK